MIIGENTGRRYDVRKDSHSLDPRGPYYINVYNQFDEPLVDTHQIRRFHTEEEAETFCRQIESGEIDVHALARESSDALHAQVRKEQEAAKTILSSFWSLMRSKGLTREDVLDVIHGYESLPALSRRMLVDHSKLNSVKEEILTPAPERVTFGTWFETTQNDVDVCVEDAETGEHYLPAVCYLTEDDKKDPDLQYTDLEQWLFTLPVERVETSQDNSQYVVLKTDFSCDETNFLLGDGSFGFDTQKWANLYDRACYADAEFSVRLRYLQTGTPFEVPFDPHCMDAASPADRQALLQFLEDPSHAFVAPAKGNFLVVYHLTETAKGGVRNEDCAVCARQTEPGRGLTASLESKLGDAQHRVAPDDIRDTSPARSQPVH